MVVYNLMCNLMHIVCKRVPYCTDNVQAARQVAGRISMHVIDAR